MFKEDNNSSNETKENTDKENSTSTPSKEVIKFENDSDTYSSLNRTSSNPDVKKRAKRSLFSLYSNENYKFEIYKYDEEDNSPLEGAEFELQSTDGNFKNIYSSDSNGKVFIDNLKSGTYSLVEKTAPLGYQKISKKWTVFVNSQGKVFISELGELAEDPQIQYRSNLTDNIKILNSSEIKSTNPVNTSNDTNKFTIDLDLQLNTSAKEGDYFTLDVSDTLHYNMIQPDKLNYPNILTADGVILAYPVINPSFDIERGTNKKISYVFTNAIEGLQSVDMKLHLEHSVNVNVAYYNRDYDFYVGIGDQTLSKRVSVVHTNVSVGKNNISNIKAAYEYVNDQNGRYVQLAYINPLSRNISGQAQIQVYPASSNSQYINTANLSDEKTTIKLYKFVGNSLPDAVIMHHSQFEEVNPSSYTVRYDYSFATPTAIIDIKNNIGTSTYLLRVESELDLDVQNPDRKPQGPIQTIVFSKGGDATSPKDVIGKTNAILVQGSSASGSGDYEKPILKVPNKKQIGEFKVIKKDKKGNLLAGVKFQLMDEKGNVKREEKTGENGEIIFKNLAYGRYWLKEIQSLPGYIVDKKPIPINIGTEFSTKIEEGYVPKDVSDLFILDKSKSSMISTENDENIVKPNMGEGISINLYYKLDQRTKINPGDTFTLKYSDNVDIDGIGYLGDDQLDIYSQAGKLASAKINEDRKSITFTFTDYVKYYSVDYISINTHMYIDRLKIKNDTSNVGISASIANQVFSDYINVSYESGYDPSVKVKNYMTKLNISNKEFTSVIYVNWQKENTFNKTLYFYSEDADIDITSVRKYRVNNINALPDSYGIDFDNLANDRNFTYLNSKFYNGASPGGVKFIKMILGDQNDYNDYQSNETYLIEVKGKVTSENAKQLKTTVEYNRFSNKRYYYDNYNYYAYYDPKDEIIDQSYTYSIFHESSAEGGGIVSLELENNVNKIVFTKVSDTQKTSDEENPQNQPTNNTLEGVSFELRKDGEVLSDSKRVSDKNGNFSYEKLASGSYELWETESLDGYALPKEAVSSFDVDSEGNIINIKDNTTVIVNKKLKANILFEKVDSDNIENKLKGAEFILEKQDENSKFHPINENGDFVEKQEDAYKVESDSSGRFGFRELDDGIYRIKEVKAKFGYKLPEDAYLYEFKVEKAKIYPIDLKENKVSEKALVNDDNNTIIIKNNREEYPFTGGKGTILFSIVGLIVMLFAVSSYTIRKKPIK
ncbi:SpaA isopeptide-forming pilin-related protein [Anaerococcus porci]|uniref:SpaA isopeptide-forming pilin-related protein n=1 Tax=Anaerococcus porci TaxID=2652269 RepID=UPI002A76164A|nr:SpaA isopeptide-forming pilin-related protein [Anaerococcus porci]MDY3006560.1 SpaA isopeptide-forming pilin-related protein [Anaerococcus porci]